MVQKPAIQIHELVKVYNGASEEALKGISLQIAQNEIFGLLGPNGAGKTTTINILCGLISMTSGEVLIHDLSLPKELQKIKKEIGVVPQDIALYPTLTARENLQFIGRMYGLKGTVLNDRIDQCLNMMGLEMYADRKINAFSGGMKRRVNLIAGILHNPGILFLDEPTVGIDVQSRNNILEYLRAMNESGTTIIYTSHYMEEAESLCSQIAIIDEGKIIAEGKPDEMIASKPEYTNLESIFLHFTGKRLRDN